MDIGAAMEANVAGYAAQLHRNGLGMTVVETDDLLIADSGLADDTFNIVAYARFPASAADDRVASTLARLAPTGRPFSWCVGPATAPADLGERLLRAGLAVGEEQAAMWAPLDSLSALEPGDLTIVRGTTPEHIAHYAQVVAANWHPPSATVVRFYELTGSGAVRGPAAYFVGYCDRRPVATAAMFGHAGVAGVYAVCTLEAYRRRGFGYSMTLAALHAAKAQGLTAAVLQASHMGEPIYRRLGFQRFATFVEYAINPPRPPDTAPPGAEDAGPSPRRHRSPSPAPDPDTRC